MARNNRGRDFKRRFEPRLKPETKNSVLAVIFWGTAAFLILSGVNRAGPAGRLLYGILEYFFGLGFYLLPFIFVALSIVFLAEYHNRINFTAFFGALIFTLAGLGFIDLISPGRGGVIGKAVGYLNVPLGFIASGVVLFVLGVVGLLITFNAPLKIKMPKFRKLDEMLERKEEITAVSYGEGKVEPEKQDSADKIEVAASSEKTRPARAPALKPSIAFKNYVLPPYDLLKSSTEKPTAGDLRANANIIRRTLESFGVPVEMGEISIGPKVTRYTLKPAEGIKLSRIIALNQDLALALAAHPIRIEAPIPGKSLVGIEVPNKASALVRLGNLISYPEFISSGLLSFALGRDVSGEPIFADIERMPHLLIAGSSGSGKSITIHSLLTSLLYKNSPETLRLILVDPKRVELTAYEGIPHLISPVIVEAKKTISVLRWLIQEMEKRYEFLTRFSVRDLYGYNKKNPKETMPYILLVIDELADLMAAYGRDVEGAIVRLAQMARATGIHLIVSTQRPSVEILTGLIKANITSRVALQVPSQIDSRTILDMSGAEKLLGGGDMLFISSEFSKPKRIQGAYISEEEMHKVVSFIKENNEGPGEDEVAFEQLKNNQRQLSIDDLEDYSDDDELLDEAVKVVTEAKKASASLLQRRLKVGYARAARLLDMMEEKGIVGPGEGAKPREVYLEENEV